MEPVYHQDSSRGRWRRWRRASRQGQPCSCLFFKTHQIGLSCAFLQSQRRPEKWTRTRKAGSRGSVTRDFVFFYFVKKNITRRRRRASFFTEPLKPNTGKPCENSLKTHLIVLLSFRVSAIQNGSMYVLGSRQLRTGKSDDRGRVEQSGELARIFYGFHSLLVFVFLSIPWPSFSLPHEPVCVAMFDRCAWCT